MEDKLKKLYDLYVQSGLIKTSDFQTFASANDQQRKKLYDLGKQKGLFKTTDYNTFSNAFVAQSPAKKKSTSVSPSVQKKKPTSSVTMPSWMQGSLEQSSKKEQANQPDLEQQRKGVYVNKEQAVAADIKASGGQYGFKIAPMSKEQKEINASIGSKVYSGFPGQEENKYRVKNDRWERLYGKNWIGVTNEGSVNALNNYFEKNLTTLKGDIKEDKEDLKRMRSVLRVEEEIAGGKQFTEKQFEERIQYYNTIETQKFLKSKGYDIDVNGMENDPKTLKALAISKAKKKTDQAIDFEIEDMRDAVDSIITNKFLMRTEEDAISVLRKQFGKQGFTFEESGFGTDYIVATSPGGVKKEFGFDYSDPAKAKAEAKRMSDFIKTGYMTKKEIQEFEGDGSNIRFKPEAREKYFFNLIGQMASNPGKYSTKLFTSKEINNHLTTKYSELKLVSKDLEEQYKEIQKRIEKFNDDPTDVKEKIAIDKELYQLKKNGLDLKEQYSRLDDAGRNLIKITGIEYAKKEKQGNFLGIITGQLAQGFTNVEKSLLGLSADILPYAIGEDIVDPQTRLRLKNEGYTDSQILDYAAKQLKGTVVKDISEGISRVASLGTTTKEYINSKDRNDLEKTVSFLSESIGTSLSAGGNPVLQKIAFFTQSYNAMEEQMSSPDFDGLTEWEKKLISVPYGFVIGALERYGFEALRSGKNPLIDKFARNVIASTMKSLPKDASVNTIKREINKSVSRMIAQGAIRTVGGALVEGGTEGTQQMAEIAEKNIVNAITEKDYFKDVPDLTTTQGIGQALNIAKTDAYYGFLGGLLYSTVSNSVDVSRQYRFDKKTDEEFKLFYDAMTDDQIIQSNKLQVKLDLKDGKITKEEAKERLASINEMNARLTSINPDMSLRDKKNAFNLILEREKLTKEKGPLDVALQAPYNERITEINNELKEISENAIQEQATGEVSIQPEAAVSGEVAQGNTQEGSQIATQEGEKEIQPEEITPIQDIEERSKEASSRMKRPDLFSDGGSFANQLGESGIDSVPTSHQEINGIEFVQFSNPTTGIVDVIMTGTSDNDFVGYYRVYENGKATNKWSSKFENRSRNKENFKTMISGVQSMLPKGHEYTEKTSISTDGLRIWSQQLDRGYNYQYDQDGNLVTNTVAINGDSIINDLGIDVAAGDFNNISVTNNKDFSKVKKALIPYMEKLGLSEKNIYWEDGTVKIDLPVLISAKGDIATQETVEATAETPTTIPTREKNFNEEEFVRDIDILEREKPSGSRNIGLFAFKDKFVKLIKGKRKTSKENLSRLRERVADMPNVFPGLEVIDLPGGKQAVVMDRATGKLASELTQEEIDSIPQEHWDGFEQTVRELSDRGVQTDLTKRSNFLYDKDKGFQFIDLEAASMDGSPTNKFFKEGDKEFYYDFEMYPVFPIEYTSAKDMFTNIESTPETKATPKIVETTDTKSYSEALSKAKAALKKEGNGLDLQVSDVSQEEADAIIADGGHIFMTEDGLAGAYVTANGYMGGLFKNPKSKFKDIAKLLQQARIKVGGRFMDAYATELERIYVKNGFRPVARLKFNEEYAPEGWNAPKSALASKPDVVFFAYDPDGKYNIGDGQYVDNYDTGYAMAENFDAKAVNEADRLAALIEGDINISDDIISREEVSSRVEAAKKALSKILPNVKFVIHDTDESYRQAVGEMNMKEQSSAGAYDMSSKTIHINGTKANNRTVSHEAFHAIIISKAASDQQLQRLTGNMINSVLRSLKKDGKNQNVIKYLEDFASNYEENLQNEEKLAELHGILGENMIELPLPTQNIIKRFLDRIAKMLGFKEMTDREAVEFMNTMSSKVETGKEITAKEFKASKGTIKDAVNRFQANFKDEVSGLEFVYDENGEKFADLEKNGFITKDKSITNFDGQYMFFHQPDAAFSGMIVKRNKKTGEVELLIEGKGGMYYPIKFHENGYFWASTNSVAEKMAKDLNEAMEQNGGKLLMALTSAPYDKLLSSTTAANSVMELISSKAFDRNFAINPAQLKNILINAAAFTKEQKTIIKDKNKKPILDKNGNVQYRIKNVGLGIKIKKGDSLEDVKSKIKELLDPDAKSFADRKTFVEAMIKETVDIINSNPKAINQFGEFFSTGIKNKYFKGTRKKGYNISAANMKQALSEMLTEPMLKEGVNRDKGGQIYAVIELDGKVKPVDSDLHESYPKAIQSVDPKNNKVKLHILTDRVKWNEVVEDFETNDIVAPGDRELEIFPTSGISVRALKVNTKNVVKEEKTPKAQIEEEVKTLGELMEPKRRKQKSEIYKEELDDNDINSLRRSLRMKDPNGYIVELLDELQKAKKDDSVLVSDEVNDMLENGITLSTIKGMLLEDEVFASGKEIDNYFVQIGGDKTKGIFNRLAGLKSETDTEKPNFRKQKPSKQAEMIVKKGKDAGFSNAGIREYMKRNGYTDRQATDAIQSYNDKQEGIFIDPDWSKLKKAAVVFKRKFLSARGLMPNTAFASNESRQAQIAKSLNMAEKNIVDFNRAMKKVANNDRDQVKKDFDAYVRGDNTITLPADLKKVADTMRAHIDSMSISLINSGLVDEHTIQKINDNLGAYLTRSYKVYDRANWKKEVEEEIKQKAINFLKTQYMPMAQEIAAEEGMDVDDVLDTIVTNKLNEILTKDGAENFISGGKMGSKNLSILKERQDIPLEIRMLMGEYTDPAQNYAKTILKMSALAANHQFLTEVKNNGTGVFLFEKNDPRRPKGFDYMIAAEGSETMNPLNGMYTTKEIKEEFEKQPAQLGAIMETYMKVLSLVKWGKTIGSLMTHAKNVFGNLGFVLVNGHWRLNEMANAYQTVRRDLWSTNNKKSREYMNHLIGLGIVKQSAGIGELRAMFKDADWDTSMIERINKNTSSKWDWVKSKFAKGAKFLEDRYQAEDDFFKIVAYENELSRYSKAMFGKRKTELTEEERAEVDKVVAEIVKNTYPTYSRIPELVNKIRRFPFIGNFISFQAESYRTAFNTAALSLDEIKSENPGIRQIGAQRLLGSVTYLSAKTAILSAFSYSAGMGAVGLLGYFSDDDEEKQKEDDVRKFIAPWSKNSDLVVLKANNGKIQYIDFSSSDPHGGINKAINSALIGKTTVDGFINALGSTIEPFIGEEMTTAAILSVKNNMDAYGKPIYNPEDTFYEKAKDISSYMLNVVQPGTLNTIRKMYKSESKLNEAIGAATGMKIYDVDVAENFGYSMIVYKDRMEDAKRIYNSEVYNKDATEQSIADAKKRAEKAMTNINKEIYDRYYAAVRLGANEDILFEKLDKFGRMSKKDMEFMFAQVPYFLLEKAATEE